MSGRSIRSTRRLNLQILHLLRLFTSTSLRISLRMCITCLLPRGAGTNEGLGPCSANKNTSERVVPMMLQYVQGSRLSRLPSRRSFGFRQPGFRSPEAARGDMRRLAELSTQSLHVMELPVQGLIFEQLRSRRVAPGIQKTVDSVDKRRSERLVQNVLHIPGCHISTVFGLALLACSPWPLQS